MELNQAFATLEKQLAAINTELHFNREAGAEDALAFAGDNGLYRLHYVADKQLLEFDCAYEENPQWSTVSRSLFELDALDDRDVKSVANEISEEVRSLFAKKKRQTWTKSKCPRPCPAPRPRTVLSATMWTPGQPLWRAVPGYERRD